MDRSGRESVATITPPNSPPRLSLTPPAVRASTYAAFNPHDAYDDRVFDVNVFPRGRHRRSYSELDSALDLAWDDKADLSHGGFSRWDQVFVRSKVSTRAADDEPNWKSLCEPVSISAAILFSPHLSQNFVGYFTPHN